MSRLSGDSAALARLVRLPYARELGAAHLWIIYALARREDGAAPAVDVRTELKLSTDIMFRAIRRLVDRGLIKRTIDPDDNRRDLLTLTPRGYEYRERVAAAYAGTEP